MVLPGIAVRCILLVNLNQCPLFPQYVFKGGVGVVLDSNYNYNFKDVCGGFVVFMNLTGKPHQPLFSVCYTPLLSLLQWDTFSAGYVFTLYLQFYINV